MRVFFVLILSIIFSVSKASDTLKIIVYFDYNKSDLNPKALNTLDSFFNSIDTNKIFIKEASINAHTDQIGNTQFNNNLSINRAVEVEAYVAKKKIITGFYWFGEDKLISKKNDEAHRQLNRRVEVLLFVENKQIVKISEPKIDSIIKKVEVEELPSKPKQNLSQIISDTSIKIGSTINLPHILFYGGRHKFLRSTYPYLDELFFTMKDNPSLKIEIQGHICCAPGIGDAMDEDTNTPNLSEERAKAVYNFLIANGIEKKRLTYKGYGHQFPLTAERNEFEAQRNRRVEIKILNK